MRRVGASTSSPPDYVLGSDDAEIARLDWPGRPRSCPHSTAPPACRLLGGSLDARPRRGDRPSATSPSWPPSLVGLAARSSASTSPGTLLAVADAPPGPQPGSSHRCASRRAMHGCSGRRTRSTRWSCACCCSICSTRSTSLRHHVAALRPGGVMLVIDADNGASRASRAVRDRRHCAPDGSSAASRARAPTRASAPVSALSAGRRPACDDVHGLGDPGLLRPRRPTRGDHAGRPSCALLAAQIVAQGIATEEELGLDTLEARLAEAVSAGGRRAAAAHPRRSLGAGAASGPRSRAPR